MTHDGGALVGGPTGYGLAAGGRGIAATLMVVAALLAGIGWLYCCAAWVGSRSVRGCMTHCLYCNWLG